MSKEEFHKKLKELINEYILLGYKLARKFPPEERYNMRSQACRALLSIMLNYVEGYARTKKKVTKNSYETSYGSLQESIYVFYLACRFKYVTREEYFEMYNLKERIAQMLWKTIEGLREDIEKEENKNK